MQTRTHSFRKTLLAASIGQSLLLAANSLQAATITVNAIDDAMVSDGNCTLREAIAAANTDAAVDSCMKGDGADSIDFDDSLIGSTITVASAMEITSELVIDGDINADNSPDITLDGNNSSHMLESTATEAKLTLNAMKLVNGYTSATGGAILFPHGALTLNDCAFENNNSNNRGGAISQSAIGATATDITVNNCTFSSNSAGEGGAISQTSGTLNITDSVFTDNQAANYGGGLFVSGGTTTTISNSTLSGNQSGLYGGGLYVDGDTTITATTISGNTAAELGGGIYNNNGALQIINSTISGNTAINNAGGGIYSFYATSIINSTIVNNTAPVTGGLAFRNFSNPMTISNSIIADNANGDCASEGTTALLTSSLIEDGGISCGTATLTGDADLGPLQDNGGPTLTHLPNASSPIIDAADNSDCGTGLTVATDQRGEARDDGSCDMGAVEVQQTATTTPSTPKVGFTNSILLCLIGLAALLRQPGSMYSKTGNAASQHHQPIDK